MNPYNPDQILAGLTDVLEKAKALSPVTLRLSGDNTIADAMLVVTATSKRHAQSIAREVAEWCKKYGQRPLHTEGMETGEWILVDANDIIIHIFLPEIRELYRIEDLIREAPKKENL